jgi:hypothetical protein
VEAIRQAVEHKSIYQVHTVVCCSLLLFLWVALADLTFLTAVWCTSQCFMTLLANSRSCDRRKGRHRQAVATRPDTEIQCLRVEKIALAIGDRFGSRKMSNTTGKNSSITRLRTVVAIGEDKILFDKGEIIRDGAALHLDQGIAVTSHASQAKTVDQVIASLPVRAFSQANEAKFYVTRSR